MASNTSVLMNGGVNNENVHQNHHQPHSRPHQQQQPQQQQHQQHHGQHRQQPQQPNGHSFDVVSHNTSFVDQLTMARQAAGSHDFHSSPGHSQHYHMQNQGGDDFDPQSNVYVANLPSDYGKERLYALFSKYGQIIRYKFVTPDEPSQPGYGFVQFSNHKDAHTAISTLEGHLFSTGETVYLSIALRRRSSLSEEPTNLYVKNLPSAWSNDKLKEVFGAYGSIRQSKVVGDGIAFVRFDDHEQALNAIGHLDKQQVEQGCQLEVRFATRKTAANAYRLQQVPAPTKHNENNLYVRNLPKYYNQSSLETLFSACGKISSAKINENGIAFVRFMNAVDAKRAIQELNGTTPPQFEEEIVVKLAHFDIGDSRNRWANKFASNSALNGAVGHGGGVAQNGPLSNGNHFNNNMYQNHMNAPVGSMSAFNGFHGAGGGNTVSSVPSSAVADPHAAAYSSYSSQQQQQQPHAQQQQQQAAAVAPQVQSQAASVAAMNQMQALQQSMQQWNLTSGSAAGVNANMNRNNLMFPTAAAAATAAPMMMPTSNLFASNAQVAHNHSAMNNDSGGTSPHSNGSNEGNGNNSSRKTNWSKKEQQLGDQLYARLVSKCPVKMAGKITGMLIKMGDKKAQQCLDNPQYLEQQIQLAKKLLTQQESTEGVPNANGPSLLKMNQLTQQLQALQNNTAGGATVTSNNPTPQLQQQPHAGKPTSNTSTNGTNSLSAQLSNMYPNSFLNAGVPNLFQTPPQLFATLSPTSTANTSAVGGNNPSPTHHQQLQTPSPQKNRMDASSSVAGQQHQYLFTTIPNLGSPMAAVGSPAQQQAIFNGTPNNNSSNEAGQTQNAAIQQSGWGLALGSHGQNNINVIPTQNATAFMNPALYPRAQ